MNILKNIPCGCVRLCSSYTLFLILLLSALSFDFLKGDKRVLNFNNTSQKTLKLTTVEIPGFGINSRFVQLKNFELLNKWIASKNNAS